MMRLDRWLVTLGTGSRTEVQRLIRRGSVTVDGDTIRDPSQSCTTKEKLIISGMETDGRLMRHVMLHKPAGLLTAARDKKQPTVMDLLPPVYAAIGCMPVGRLDKDTTGLLLFTCDGELNHRLLAPGRHVDKQYRAQVTGMLTASDVSAFSAGIELDDFTAQPADLTIVSASNDTSVGIATVHEGKFHQVKRMFSAIGHEVTALHRMTFGPLSLDDKLPEDSWRELTEEETTLLYQAAGMEKAE